MTINKACIKKSLITDYRIFGMVAAVCFVVIGAVWGLINLSGQIGAVLVIIVQPFTAVNVFIISEIIAIGLWVMIFVSNIMTTKEELKKEGTTPAMIFISTFTMALVYIMYYAVSSLESWQSWNIQSPFPDIFLIFLMLLAFNVFIVCPFSIAYARCRE